MMNDTYSSTSCGTRTYVRVRVYNTWMSVSVWDLACLIFPPEECQCAGSKGRRELAVMTALVR